MTDEDPNVKEQEAETSQDPVDKKEFTRYLTSTGRIKQVLAESLYEQGLDSYEKLESGDEEYFRTFKRVGPTSAEALIELGKKKKPEAAGPLEGDDLKELLLTLPRIGKAQVEHIFSAGYDTGRKIVEGGVDGLLTVKGIGAGKAEAILNAVKPLVPDVPEGEVKIEDATAEIGEEESTEEEKEEGFFSRMAKKIRGIFGKGDDKEETEDSEGEGSPGEGDDEPSDEEGSEEEAQPSVDEEEKAEEEPPVEEPVEEPAEEEKIEEPVEEEGKSEEPKAEAPDEEETPEEPSVDEDSETVSEEPEEEEAEKKGFFARFVGFFKKDKGEEEAEEKPSEEEESEEEAPEEEEKAEEDSEEKPSEGEEGSSEGETEEEKPEDVAEEAPEEAESPEEEKPEIEKFHDIPGISAVNADKLYEAGYSNVDELREAVWDDLTLIEGIGEKTAKKIIEAVSK